MPKGAAKLRTRREMFRALLGESPGGERESPGGEGEPKEEQKRQAPEGDAKGAGAAGAAPAPRRKGVRPGAIPAVRFDDEE